MVLLEVKLRDATGEARPASEIDSEVESIVSEAWSLLLLSGEKKEPKPKLFGPDIFGWGGGLSREWVGAKKFGMSFETQGNQTFWRDIRDSAGISQSCPKSLRNKKSLCSILVP